MEIKTIDPDHRKNFCLSNPLKPCHHLERNSDYGTVQFDCMVRPLCILTGEVIPMITSNVSPGGR